ncbi:hypothetical protein LL06_21065 [Hoeflea sp. BAL378]|uniref:hypothetical protein n=1 Tax=Hoeflea sp. BAL378 TaxID=1547437 RepID=UPI000513D9E5|nr:hypothetical protein [Hoeflea sp. BAL378]KGF67601.1 hypothetical protein LL06_21065 [Hoeflea sp. BAL378]
MAGTLVPSRAEAGRSLAGLFYLILKRPEGLRLIDASPDGFWRSFGVFAWAWPVQCFLWTGMWRALPDTRPETAGETIRFFFVSTSFDVAAWVAPAALLFAVSQLFGLSGKFAQLVVVTNWYGLLSAYVGFFPAALRYLAPLPETANAFVSLFVYLVVIWLYYRVIRACLGGDLMVPIFITVMMVMTGLIVSELAFDALGG